MAKSGNWTAPKLSNAGDDLRKSLFSIKVGSAKKEPKPSLNDQLRYQASRRAEAAAAEASKKRKAKQWRDPESIRARAATEKSARGKNERAAARAKARAPKGPQGPKR